MEGDSRAHDDCDLRSSAVETRTNPGDAATGAEIERVENPLLRYTELARGKTHGTLWVWGRTGRPAAVLELIGHADKNEWGCCFHATGDKPVKMTAKTGETWTPQASDLKFQALPNAPPPADSPAARMRQMREFGRKFSAHVFWEKARQEMRLLPTAVHRYSDRDHHLVDGAIFAIAVGTHVEATLFLEAAHPVNEPKPLWQFAVGRSGTAEMIVAYDDKEVHHGPQIENFPPPTSSYWRMTFAAKAEQN